MKLLASAERWGDKYMQTHAYKKSKLNKKKRERYNSLVSYIPV